MLWTGRTLSLVLLCASAELLFAGSIPVVGSKAPGFTLQSQDGHVVTLKDYRGRWVVLFFYPFPGRCALETDDFQRDQADYEKKNTVVLGISVDDVGSQKNCARESASFELLADTAGVVSRKYGSLTNLLFVKVDSRNTFVIDPQGKIAKVFTDVISPAQQSRQVLAALGALQQARSARR
jgi:thioredoxin-dependent peroxiredoxin